MADTTMTTTEGDSKPPPPSQPQTNQEGAYDEIECSLGISEFYSTSVVSGFSAVVKARYSDFLVHEIDMNGNIARLTSLEVPKSEAPAEAEVEKKQETTTTTTTQSKAIATEEKTAESAKEETKMDVETTNKESEATESNETKGPPFEEFETQLSALINNSEISKSVMEMLKSHNNHNSRDESAENQAPTTEKFVTLPALEKQQRKSVHEWVRNVLTCARADTLDGKIRIWHCKFEKEMPNYKAFGTHKKRKMSDRALKKKQRNDWPKDRPDFLKFVLYKENCDTTTATKEIGRRGSTARIGYAGMKDKRGITTQFCTLYRTLPEQIAKGRHPQRGGGGGNTKQKGYSIVHIGNFEYVSRELRLGSLKGNRFDIVLRNVKLLEDSGDSKDAAKKRKLLLQAAATSMKEKGFINYFGTQRFGKFHNTHLVGIAVLQGDFEKACNILMAPNSEDRPDIEKARKDWEERFTYGKTKENESSTAKRVLKRLNRFMTAEIAILQSLARNPFDYKRAFSCIPKNLRMMFIHAVQSLIWNKAASHRISKMDNTKVLAGDLVPNTEENPSNSRVYIVTEDDLKKRIYSMEDVLIPLVGTKTIYPQNELGNTLKILLSDLGLTIEMFKNCEDREVRANGDYRKAIIHPKDFDYEIKEYYHPLQPLLQTDLMKLNGEEITIEQPENKETKEESKEEKVEGDEKESKSPPKPLIGMAVGFTLPSSSYATIALRELMKTPTSNEYQSKLKLE